MTKRLGGFIGWTVFLIFLSWYTPVNAENISLGWSYKSTNISCGELRATENIRFMDNIEIDNIPIIARKVNKKFNKRARAIAVSYTQTCTPWRYDHTNYTCEYLPDQCTSIIGGWSCLASIREDVYVRKCFEYDEDGSLVDSWIEHDRRRYRNGCCNICVMRKKMY